MRNITDVDDKINARAARDYPGLPHNEAIREVTRKTEEQFHADIRALGVLMPEDVNEAGKPPRFVEPRATEHIDEMRMIIERLIARGDGLCGRGARAVLASRPCRTCRTCRNTAPSRSAPSTSCCPAPAWTWRPTSATRWTSCSGNPRARTDPAWASPAGIATPGRPGWHIECSAMAWKHLVQAFETRLTCSDPTEREIFDIHGGGIDLVFPHHENEIAQSCCAFDTPRMANVWMHNGFLQVEGEKMSKSLGNFFTINELLQDWPGEVLRFNMLRTHYRQPIDWTVKGLEESEKTLDRWYELAGRGETAFLSDQIVDALADDLNTPKMLAELHALDGQGAYEELGANLRALGFLLEGAEALEGAQAGGTQRRSRAGRSADRRPQGSARRQELGRVRPHPRRARGIECRGEGQQGRHHHLGGGAMIDAPSDTPARHPRPYPGRRAAPSRRRFQRALDPPSRRRLRPRLRMR